MTVYEIRQMVCRDAALVLRVMLNGWEDSVFEDYGLTGEGEAEAYIEAVEGLIGELVCRSKDPQIKWRLDPYRYKPGERT